MPKDNCSDVTLEFYYIPELTFNFSKGILKYDISMEMQGTTRAIEEKGKSGELSLRVEIIGTSETKQCLRISAVIEGKFASNTSMKKEVFEKCCIEHGSVILYTILRTVILSFTSDAGMTPGLALPFISPSTIKQVTEKKSEPQEGV